MSHDGERANDARLEQQHNRAPPHGLDPLVGHGHFLSSGGRNSAVQPTPKPGRSRSSSTTRPIFSLPPACRTNSTAFTLNCHRCPASGTSNTMPAVALPSMISPINAKPKESILKELSIRNLFMLAPNYQGERREAAAADVRFVSEPGGCLP